MFVRIYIVMNPGRNIPLANLGIIISYVAPYKSARRAQSMKAASRA